MLAKDMIERKRDGEELSADEIESFISGYMDGSVSDSQASAFAMAVCCRGMSDGETAALTGALLHSGRTLEWEGDLPSADKHSTGGVGDKLSLVIQPVAAACGLRVPSLVGRSLGFTGGTADKLESIPGYNVSPSLERFRAVVVATGLSMATQTDEITPADRKLYALRDVTGTVASIPLITASILSKKLAEGAGTLVFDVRCGRGAFMRTLGDARALAQSLVAGARAAGRKVAAAITPMDAPIGFAVGNANEVAEALAVLRCEPGAAVYVKDAALYFAAKMVSLAKGIPGEQAMQECSAALANGAALARFEAMVAANGGDIGAFERSLRTPCARFRLQAARGGYVSSIDARIVAQSALVLGAGRQSRQDAIDPLAGVTLAVRAGDRVSPGDALATLVKSGGQDGLESAAAMLQKAFSFSRTPVAPVPIFMETVE